MPNAQVSAKPLHVVIATAPCTTWKVAEIKDTVTYWRGAKTLEIPDQFRDAFPGQSWEGYVDPVELEWNSFN